MKNSILDITVSGFASVEAVEPRPVNLLTWLTSAKYKAQVEAVRKAPTEEIRKALKKTLPAITPSGIFNRRNLAGLVKHSGFICLDIDQKENKHVANFHDLKRHLSKIQNFAYVGTSVSGNGYYCLVPISQPGKHKQQFEALRTDLLQFGITVDQSGSDITRLRIYSYDPEAYFNHEAKVYSKIFKEQPARVPEMSKVPKVPKCQTGQEDHFFTLLDLIQSTGTDITAGYGAWFQIGCAIANEYKQAGRSYFHVVSKFNDSYNSTKVDRQFDHCLKHSYQYSIKTFFHYCKQYGITLDRVIK